MYPLMRTGPFLLHEFPERFGSAGKNSNIRRIPIATHALFHAGDDSILKILAPLMPFFRLAQRVRYGTEEMGRRPNHGNIFQPTRRVSIVSEVKKPPCPRRGRQ